MPESVPAQRNLPRLASASYRGFAAVHWTFTLERRAVGWLEPLFHARFREVLAHASHRHGLACPIYSLMPDHMHLLLLGLREDTDQATAVRFLRRHVAPALRAPAAFQKQAHDHVLREAERARDAFPAVCRYIAENPVRAGLSAKASDYAFTGALFPGYPTLDPFAPDYWTIFWKAHHALVDAA